MVAAGEFALFPLRKDWHLRANGGLLSTAGDLHRWSLALQGEGVLSKAAKEKQFTPHVSEGLFGGGTVSVDELQ